MKHFFRGIVIVAFSLVAAAQQTVAGEWLFTAHEQFGPAVMRMTLSVTGDKLTGTLGGRSIEGVVRGTTIDFKMDNATLKGAVESQGMNGDATFPNRVIKWTAVRIPPRPPAPRTHDFEPTAFHSVFLFQGHAGNA